MNAHKNQRRPRGLVADEPVYAGWSPMPCAVWMEVAEGLPLPWPRRFACADLGVYQSVAIQPTKPVRFPAIGDLATRWGWTAHEVRKLLVDEPAWSDPTLAGSGDRAARWQAIKDARTARSGSHGLRTDRARMAQGLREDSTVEATESNAKTLGTRTDDARTAITFLNTRVGSQSTDTEHRHREHHAPALAVADLFAALPNPDSQPSAATGEAAGETTPPPGPVAPLPVKAKLAKRSTGHTVTLEDVDAVIDLWAKVCPRTEKQAARMKTSDTARRQIAAAIERDGANVVRARFAYIAGGSGGQAKWARECIANPDRPMQIDALLRDPSRQDRNKGGPPWVASVDGEAAEYAEQEAPEPVTTTNAPTGEVSEAAAAWASMTMRVEWRLLDRGGAPKRPEDADRTDAPGVVFADEPAEHVRRWHAYRAAGGTKRWREVRGDADRHAFRHAFEAAYESGVLCE